MEPGEAIHVCPEYQCGRYHLEAYTEKIGLVVVAPQDQQPVHEEQVLEVLKMHHHSGVQRWSRHIQVSYFMRIISQRWWHLGEQVVRARLQVTKRIPRVSKVLIC